MVGKNQATTHFLWNYAGWQPRLRSFVPNGDRIKGSRYQGESGQISLPIQAMADYAIYEYLGLEKGKLMDKKLILPLLAAVILVLFGAACAADNQPTEEFGVVYRAPT